MRIITIVIIAIFTGGVFSALMGGVMSLAFTAYHDVKWLPFWNTLVVVGVVAAGVGLIGVSFVLGLREKECD